MKQRIIRIFNDQFEYFTFFIPLNSVVKPKFKDTLIKQVQAVSPFIREVILKVQMFLNYYILSKCTSSIPNVLLTQNFLYGMCSIIFAKTQIQDLQER